MKENSDSLFLGLAIVMRFFQGLADTLVNVAVYSIVTFEFPTKKEQYFGYIQSSVGVGYMVGPVLGSVLYSKLNYQWTFYVFGGILTLASIVVFFLLPSRINHQQPIYGRVASEDPVLIEQASQIKAFFTNKRVLYAIISSMLSMIFMQFFQSILSIRLI